jgi:hypothetical protein
LRAQAVLQGISPAGLMQAILMSKSLTWHLASNAHSRAVSLLNSQFVDQRHMKVPEDFLKKRPPHAVAVMVHPGFAESYENPTNVPISRFFSFDNTVFSASFHDP